MPEPGRSDPGALPMLLGRTAAAPYTSARSLRRDAVDGHLRRLRAGVYASSAQWNAASDRRRALTRIRAVVHTRRRRPVLSHESAAAAWGLAHIGPTPETVELADVGGTAPRSEHGVRWRRTPVDLDEVVEIDGLLVTGLVQTLVDLACSRGFLGAVVALDAGMGEFLRTDVSVTARGVVRAELLARLDTGGRRRGSRGARDAIEFADGRSESVGESLSRGQMHLLGFPPPELQVEFARSDGGVDRVDFDWPEHGVFGEFDGDLKYLDPRFRGGRSIEQVLLDEKKRDDRIRRRYARRSAHWDWDTAIAPTKLMRALLDAGLPQLDTHSRGAYRPR